ncbi:ABC transporter substrate-binding protein [Tardiphaga sp. 42S5]|uniref:ABC transporter substrate-binding protein n=1 Tax=Tardiphaga sp. 42S5 TaxID=1404799 RepID=UPI002A5AE15D|nr:ABC transporter substrate-binding protein [Tardiphaga sp. 42S5]WPO41696.1 ABC transporter substrate-binding protein [Tardiphaga sp. 42S5]
MRPHKASICATLFALALALPASAQQTIKIGSSLGLTGYGSATDGHWRDGMQIAIEAVNAQGGVLGKKLELVIEDNKSTPQQAVVVYRKMMTDDKVTAFDSGCISAGNFAAASFVSRAKLPMFLCSILPRQPDEQKWAFQFLPPPKFEVDARYQYLKDKTDIRKVGILSDPSPYSLLMRGLAEKGAEEFGLTVVANESYQQDDADFSVQIGRINAAGAGAIIMLGQGNAVVTVVNNIRSLGLTKMLMLGSINELDILLSAGKVLGDQYLVPSPLIQVAADDIKVITDPAARAAAEPFVKAMKAKFGKSDNAQASRAWDSIMMMAAAMKKANSTDGTAVRDAFEKLGHYDGAGASYDFSAENHIGIIKNPYVIASVKDGVLVLKK